MESGCQQNCGLGNGYHRRHRRQRLLNFARPRPFEVLEPHRVSRRRLLRRNGTVSEQRNAFPCGNTNVRLAANECGERPPSAAAVFSSDLHDRAAPALRPRLSATLVVHPQELHRFGGLGDGALGDPAPFSDGKDHSERQAFLLCGSKNKCLVVP